MPMEPHISPFASSRTSAHVPSLSATHAYTPNKLRLQNMNDETHSGLLHSNGRAEHSDAATEDDPRVVTFRDLFALSDGRLSAYLHTGETSSEVKRPVTPSLVIPEVEEPVKSVAQPKRPARKIDEDDYGDDDDDDDEKPVAESPLLLKATISSSTRGNASPSRPSTGISVKPPLLHRPSGTSDVGKSAEDARKRAQQDKQAAEDAAKRNFHNMFYTLEHDKAAMLEQQKLDELDRQVEAEVSGDKNRTGNTIANGLQPGSLSSANLGASSLMLKHLLARIDAKRHMVHAQDSQLRRLISEVRKNRSKWANEEKVGQEELYEAAEKVLQELKAMTEYSAPFLNRVSKRDAPNYYQVIKQPMDIGTMMKKLKNLQYKSKKEFVDDLNLIWSNCLLYNTDPNHFLRKKALYMQKQTENLVFLIPDIVVRDRAEVEAEERKMQNLDADVDGLEDSDDEPIMASRGRKAPSKSMKGNTVARKAPPAINEGTPGPDVKPSASQMLRTNSLRADSDAPTDGMTNGYATPPPGNLTPHGMNGYVNGSQADISEGDGPGISVSDLPQNQEMDYTDMEFRTWKQITKKPRAVAAAERHRLFVNHRINPEEPALLRSKAGMRRFARIQQQILKSSETSKDETTSETKEGVAPAVPGESLAEGVEAAEDDNILPDYYDPISAIPDIDEKLRWEVDEEGQLISHVDEDCLRVVPDGHFTSPDSVFSRKMNANMRQMQETRKICAKIGIVKQMQMQMQMYQNQFQKYDPKPFFEADIEKLVVSHDGPIMSPEVCRAALQRSIGKVFYHAGFEDFQPTALEAATDFIGEHFQRLVRTFSAFSTAPRFDDEEGDARSERRYSPEEAILHTFYEHSIDLDGLEGYVKDEVERLGGKLSVMHERMKSHLADMLRPALDASAGADGVGAFNDGSEQFVSGDFAEELNEDFFGFRELGLDKEYGMESFNVPFHLLQNRMHNAYHTQNNTTSSLSGDIMEAAPNFEPLSNEVASDAVGLVQEYFLRLIQDHNNEALIEDDDLPPKQRFPKPRLPPSGKITSPRKRPIREQQQMAKKKRKLEEGREEVLVNGVATNAAGQKPLSKLKLDVPAANPPMADPEKEDDTGMMSPPESM